MEIERILANRENHEESSVLSNDSIIGTSAAIKPEDVPDADPKSTDITGITNIASEYTDNDLDDVEEDLQEEFNPFLFIKTLPPYECIEHNIPICLPPKEKGAPKNTLVLDLDETLVHCNIGPIPNPDLFFSVDFEGYSYDIYLKIRPYFYYFLEEVSKLYEVVIFTASQKVYADKLLDILDPQKKYTKYRVFRDSCIVVDGNYIKDLSVLGRDLAHVAIIDNSPHAFGYNLENGIPINSWFDDPNDEDLWRLLPFLRRLAIENDVRPAINYQYNLRALVDNIQCEELW